MEATLFICAGHSTCIRIVILVRDNWKKMLNGSSNMSIIDSPCDLTTGYSFILQSVLGVLAFSTLVCKYLSCRIIQPLTCVFFFLLFLAASAHKVKRYREPRVERRPFGIWQVKHRRAFILLR